ncbi:MAG: G5 domain-containing protein [Micromonosporaceae bacterium]|nr:G5 domain-containing protein [Micromonosporaceae bacterium]
MLAVGIGLLAVLCCGGVATIGALAGNPRTSPATNRADDRGADPAANDDRATPLSSPATSGMATPWGSATASTSPTVEVRTVTETQSIPFGRRTVNDSSLSKGTTKVRTRGIAGLKRLTYQVTVVNGVQTGKTLLREDVVKQPVAEVVAVGTKAPQCDPNYIWACVPIASDVDCAGGSGDGPAYVQGPVKVVGRDIYHLDADGDGIGCE